LSGSFIAVLTAPWEKSVAKLAFPDRSGSSQRASERRRMSFPARLMWKDATGAVRFASVTTRDVSDIGVFVECESASAIPLYRIVQLQLERPAEAGDALPRRLRQGRVLSAVWRVAPCKRTTGTPAGYALRFLVDPNDSAFEGGTERMAS
jgi:hypothetical protein